MPGVLAVSLPLIASAVFIASAVAKLRRPDDLAGWAELGVPRSFRKTWLLRIHPWAELLLGVALAVLGGVLGFLAGVTAVAVMTAYLWLVVRVHRRADDASCSCFGARRPVTSLTIFRNAWLLLVTAGTTAVIWMNPLWGGAVLAGAADTLWIVGLAVAAVTATVILWPDGAEAPAPAPATAGDADDLDYIRTRTPAVPVTLADGTTQNLRELAAHRPLLLLAVSETCGACVPVIEGAPRWRELLPEVEIRLLLSLPSDTSRLTERTEPQSLHDVNGFVRSSIEEWATPTAVLLGADGLLAGGPVTGDRSVEAFVGDIYESLHGERPAAERDSTATVTSP